MSKRGKQAVGVALGTCGWASGPAAAAGSSRAPSSSAVETEQCMACIKSMIALPASWRLLFCRQRQEGQSGRRLRQSGRTPESSPLPRFCDPRRSNCCVLHFLQYCGWAGRAGTAVSATRRQQRGRPGGRRAAAAPTAQAQPDPRTLVASVRTSRHSLLMQRLCARGSLSPSGLSFAPSAIWAAALAQRRLLTACDHSRGLSAGPSRCCRAPRRPSQIRSADRFPTARRSLLQACRAASGESNHLPAGLLNPSRLTGPLKDLSASCRALGGGHQRVAGGQFPRSAAMRNGGPPGARRRRHSAVCFGVARLPNWPLTLHRDGLTRTSTALGYLADEANIELAPKQLHPALHASNPHQSFPAIHASQQTN